VIPVSISQRARSASDSPERPAYLPGVFICKFKQDLIADFPDLGTASIATLKSLRLPGVVEEPLRDLRRRRLIQDVVPLFAESPPRRGIALAVGMGSAVRDATETRGLDVTTGMRVSTLAIARSVREVEDKDLRGINLVRVSSNTDVAAIVKDLNGSKGIEYCERIPARWAATSTRVHGSVNPMLNRQWGLRAIHWFDTGRDLDASEIKVAVLDTGVDEGHPDLGRLTIAEYNHDGLKAEDIVGHGTHVCGIIAANPGKGVGITGVSNCKIHVWKIFSDVPASNGEYPVDDVPYLRALRAVQSSGMQVVNLSIAGKISSTTEAMLFRNLIGADIIVVAAMGNDYERGNPPEYPAAYDDVLAVGATDEADRRAAFSNTGSHIAISAPGANILSTLPTSKSSYRKTLDLTNYVAWSGTSMAAPHVTAAASLVMVAKPGLSPKQVIDRLKSTASTVPDMSGKKRTNEFGSGLLDLKSAVN
jgi:subtilisin family serine protease